MIEDLPPREMYRILKSAQADIMLSGGRTQFVGIIAAGAIALLLLAIPRLPRLP